MENFIIISKIGEGAYSTVYTVRRKSDNQLYALKKVKIKALTPKEKQNALNEVRILASVKSAYVISYKEAFIDELDSTLCIVMEYADEGDLFQKITLYKKRHVSFEEIDIWRIFVQITKGLHDLHEYNILHRDMKSANVFLFRDGTAKLGDLNVSKVAHRGLGCTQTGTPYYASPEVWKDNPYDLKSDIWSLGCVAYEMIMLKTPFRAETMEGLFKKIMKGEYQKISKRYTEDLDYVISLLLQVNPKSRPTTGAILELPEVKDKIEEYDIFRNMRMMSNISSGSANKSFNSRKDRMTINTNESSNIGDSRVDELKKGLQYNKGRILKEIEEDEMENKMVLETIYMPKKLIFLNKRLPTSNYDTDKNEDFTSNNIKNMSFPNKMLPLIQNNRYKNNILQNYENLKQTKPQIDNKINTLHFKLKKNKGSLLTPGKIDMIIEEENIKKKAKIGSKSVNKMKDLKFIYKPYIPQILSSQKTLKNNLSEKSIFGNLNYSINHNLLRGKPDTKSNSEVALLKYKKRKLIPIMKIKLKEE